jgi:cytochrome b subunit of formate dehydrogenase
MSKTPEKNKATRPAPKPIANKKAKVPAAAKQNKGPAASDKARYYQRFHWTQRITHALLLTSFTLLGITGLPQKFSLTGWAQFLIKVFGGIETTRLIHHVCATVLMLLAIYHILDLGYKIFVRRVRLTMLPGFKDVKDALQAFGYNLGIVKKRPQMGRYTFEEKMEYWALVWGTVIMGITGFMMWNPIATTKLLPGEIIPASKAAHGGEALLAVAAIVIWHMYGVHIKRFNKAMFTGKMTEEEMLHEHPLELADIKAGIAERPVDPKVLRKRQAIYWPIAGVLAALMLFGVYNFVGAETTATTYTPQEANEIPVFLPRTPTPVSNPGNLPTWDATIGSMLQSKCSMCHGATQATNGLSFASYADIMRGGNDGTVIVPGEIESSKIIAVQSSGNHQVQLTPEELDVLKAWILAGALEK